MKDLNIQGHEPLDRNAPYLIEHGNDDLPMTSKHISGATAAPLKDFLTLIATLPHIEPGGDFELAKQIEAGVLAEAEISLEESKFDLEYRRDLEQVAKQGKRARTLLVEGHLQLAVKAAQSKSRQGVSVLDLIQEGALGLMRAVDSFDYTKDDSFSLYAEFWIELYIERAVKSKARTIRLPLFVEDQIENLQNAQRELSPNVEREPSNSEIATKMKTSAKRVAELKVLHKSPISLSEPFWESGETLGEILQESEEIEVFEHIANLHLRQKMQQILWSLTERESRVIRSRIGWEGLGPMTLEEIGFDLGLSGERIRQIAAKAINRLQGQEVTRELNAYIRGD